LTIATVAATNHVGGRAIALTIAYAAGAAVPMLLIAYGGQGLGRRLRADAPRVRFASGIVIGLVALAIAFNQDSRFQTALPGYTEALQKHVEDTATARHQLAKVTGTKARKPAAVTTAAPPGKPLDLRIYGMAPPLNPSGDWFNSKPLTSPTSAARSCRSTSWTYRASTACARCRTRSLARTYHRDGS
jgi:hypothetical protein